MYVYVYVHAYTHVNVRVRVQVHVCAYMDTARRSLASAPTTAARSARSSPSRSTAGGRVCARDLPSGLHRTRSSAGALLLCANFCGASSLWGSWGPPSRLLPARLRHSASALHSYTRLVKRSHSCVHGLPGRLPRPPMILPPGPDTQSRARNSQLLLTTADAGAISSSSS